MSAERKRNGLKLAVPVQPAKVHRRSLARSRQKWATIIRFLKILFLSLGRRWFIQIWCAPYPNIKYSSSEVSFFKRSILARSSVSSVAKRIVFMILK